MFIFRRLERKLDNITRLLVKKESDVGQIGVRAKALEGRQSELEARIKVVEEALMVLFSKNELPTGEELEKKDKADPKDIVDAWRNGEGDDKWTGLP